MEDEFQGVACCSLDKETSIKEVLFSALNLKRVSSYHGVECYELILCNKYYEAAIQLYDSNKISSPDILKRSHAVILHANGRTVTTDQLDEKLNRLRDVIGEPRILFCHGIDEDSVPFRTLQDWCITNGYDLLLADTEDATEQMIDSLSAYKWVHMSSPTEQQNSDTIPQNGSQAQDPDVKDRGSADERQLDSEMMKKFADFDSLLNKINTYRDNPQARGDPISDKNLEEIAELLSGLLGDDLDNI